MLKRVLHKTAWGMEGVAERLFRRGTPEKPVIDPYRGYGVPGGVVVRARVLAALRRTTPEPGQGRWQNLKEMASLFLTREAGGVEVVAVESGASALSDEEGYVTLEIAGDFAPGWHRIALQIAGDPASRVQAGALVPGPEARIGVVSDIDDTMMRTGAYSLAKNLWTTFTGSHESREVFADAVALVERLSAGGRNPVFYVSSSPWNMHAFLVQVFDRAGLAAGPMFLRDYGIGETQFITAGHGDHKGRAIDRIMDANPGLPFVLIGDTGQKDAAIYLEAARRHEGRVAAVILREPRPGPGARSRAAIAELEAMGVAVAHGPDFEAAAETLARAGVDIRGLDAPGRAGLGGARPAP